MLETTLAVMTICLLGMLSPGPDTFLVIKNAIFLRRTAAFMTALGIVTGICTHLIYCVAGLAVVIITTPWLFSALKYAGAAYLIFIGIQALLAHTSNAPNSEPVTSKNISLQQAFIQGYLCNLLNPKAPMFSLAIFTQVIDVNASLAAKLWYATVIGGMALIWLPLLVILIQRPMVRRALTKTQKYINKVFGCVLIAFGIQVALS